MYKNRIDTLELLATALLRSHFPPLELDHLAHPLSPRFDPAREREWVTRKALGKGVDRGGFLLARLRVERRLERESPQEAGEDDKEGALCAGIRDVRSASASHEADQTNCSPRRCAFRDRSVGRIRSLHAVGTS